MSKKQKKSVWNKKQSSITSSKFLKKRSNTEKETIGTDSNKKNTFIKNLAQQIKQAAKN